jgi:hypothetical protein
MSTQNLTDSQIESLKLLANFATWEYDSINTAFQKWWQAVVSWISHQIEQGERANLPPIETIFP